MFWKDFEIYPCHVFSAEPLLPTYLSHFMLNIPLCFKSLQFLTSQPSEKLCVSAGLELSWCRQRPSFCLTPRTTSWQEWLSREPGAGSKKWYVYPGMAWLSSTQRGDDCVSLGRNPSSLLASTESCISEGCWQMWVWSCTSVPVLMTSLLGRTEFSSPLTFVSSTLVSPIFRPT